MVEIRLHPEGSCPSLFRRCAMVNNTDAFDDLPCFYAQP